VEPFSPYSQPTGSHCGKNDQSQAQGKADCDLFNETFAQAYWTPDDSAIAAGGSSKEKHLNRPVNDGHDLCRRWVLLAQNNQLIHSKLEVFVFFQLPVSEKLKIAFSEIVFMLMQ
jgi:hypothetical protein